MYQMSIAGIQRRYCVQNEETIPIHAIQVAQDIHKQYITLECTINNNSQSYDYGRNFKKKEVFTN